ncbi:MAG: cytochrome P450 [Candidatus Binatia bacterium]|nr:cytochrome P450 [Candidatus Binatia bacterium]MDG2011187.1 cytochrome P450 [Candidatus Binatia bacterium]
MENQLKFPRAPVFPEDPRLILSDDFLQNPHPMLRELRENHPVARVGDTGVHLLSSWAIIVEALGREEDFSANLTGVLLRDVDGTPTTFDLPVSAGTQVIATADEPAHARHRNLVRARLLERQIAAMEPEIRAWVRSNLRTLLDAGGGDFVPLAETVPARVIGHLLGLPAEDVDQHRQWAMMGGEMLAGDLDLQRMQGLAEDTLAMAVYLSEHLPATTSPSAANDQAPTLMELLAGGVASEAIDPTEAIGIAIVMFGAGGESTSALLGSAIRLLAEDPELADELRCEPTRIPAFIEEVLRLEPPFKFHYRSVRRACELGGFALEAGDRLMLLWAAANRDPAVYDEPEQLQLDRTHPRHHMSFGRGAHFCVGAHLARLEARVVLEELLGSTNGFQLDDSAKVRHANSIFVRRLAHLPIRLQAVR